MAANHKFTKFGLFNIDDSEVPVSTDLLNVYIQDLLTLCAFINFIYLFNPFTADPVRASHFAILVQPIIFNF